MPGIIDKIYYNSGKVTGKTADIHAAHEVQLTYAKEIFDGGWLDHPDVVAIQNRMEKACAVNNEAQSDYCDESWAIAEAMRKVIDKLRSQSPTP